MLDTTFATAPACPSCGPGEPLVPCWREDESGREVRVLACPLCRYSQPQDSQPKPYGDGKTTCPLCRSELVSNCHYIEGRGYVVVVQCIGTLGDDPTCTFRRVL